MRRQSPHTKIDPEAMERIRKALMNMESAYKKAAVKSASAGTHIGEMSAAMRPTDAYGPDQAGLR